MNYILVVQNRSQILRTIIIVIHLIALFSVNRKFTIDTHIKLWKEKPSTTNW